MTDHAPRRRTLRNYWIFSAAVAIVWVIVITIHAVAAPATMRDTWLIFGGFAIGWVATTIARYVYPPAHRWMVLPPAE